MKISLVINTLNEEEHIAACIGSARAFAGEVIVADMGSTDRTAEIAAGLGARVHTIPRVKFVDLVRNDAIALASGDWILVLDADERLTPEVEVQFAAIVSGDSADVVDVPFEVLMFGRPVRYSGWQDARKKIFFKKGFLRFSTTEVHGQPEWQGRLQSLDKSKGALLHYNYRDVRHFVEKMNDYTDGEALKLLRAGARCTPLRGLYWGARHFLRRYVGLSGFRDGAQGLVVCALMGVYWFLAFCKAWQRGGGGRAR